MGVIVVLDHIDHCYSNSDGEVIRNLINQNFKQGSTSEISFKGVDSVSSSFINSALIDLLDVYSFDDIKKNVTFIDSSRSINDLIKKRFSFEVNERKKLLSV